MKLNHLLKGIGLYDLSGNPDLEIKGLTYDSRQLQPGSLFVALRGHQQNGHDYLHDAIRKGAVALVAEEFKGIGEDVTKVKVPNSREALSKLAVQFYDTPCRGLTLIGITGTNGKTTTCYLLESILRAAGRRPGVLGTIAYRFSGKVRPASVTTPESLELMRLMREMADAGATDVIMEASSHALDQGRTQDCPFKVAIFTNLTRDHLDYHGNMDAIHVLGQRDPTTRVEISSHGTNAMWLRIDRIDQISIDRVSARSWAEMLSEQLLPSHNHGGHTVRVGPGTVQVPPVENEPVQIERKRVRVATPSPLPAAALFALKHRRIIGTVTAEAPGERCLLVACELEHVMAVEGWRRVRGHHR